MSIPVAVAQAVPVPVRSDQVAVLPDVPSPVEHTELRKTIYGLRTVRGCVDLYSTNIHFQQCIGALRQVQDLYIAIGRTEPFNRLSVSELREEWAMRWVHALTRYEEWAKTLNECRKTVLELLYKVCDLCFDDVDVVQNINPSDELEGVFGYHRVDELLVHCLVMDRVNALFNMTIRATGEQGLGWYSKYDKDRYQQKFHAPLNPRGATINKRLFWLVQVPELGNNPAIQGWMEIDIPARLRYGNRV